MDIKQEILLSENETNYLHNSMDKCEGRCLDFDSDSYAEGSTVSDQQILRQTRISVEIEQTDQLNQDTSSSRTPDFPNFRLEGIPNLKREMPDLQLEDSREDISISSAQLQDIPNFGRDGISNSQLDISNSQLDISGSQLEHNPSSQLEDIPSSQNENNPNFEGEDISNSPKYLFRSLEYFPQDPQIENISIPQPEHISNTQLEDSREAIPSSLDISSSQLQDIPTFEREDISSPQLGNISISQLEDNLNSPIENIPSTQLEKSSTSQVVHASGLNPSETFQTIPTPPNCEETDSLHSNDNPTTVPPTDNSFQSSVHNPADLNPEECSLIEFENSLLSMMENGSISSEEPILIDSDSGSEISDVEIKKEPAFDISVNDLEDSSTFGLDITMSNLEEPTVCMVEEPNDFEFQESNDFEFQESSRPAPLKSRKVRRPRKAPASDPAFIPAHSEDSEYDPEPEPEPEPELELQRPVYPVYLNPAKPKRRKYYRGSRKWHRKKPVTCPLKPHMVKSSQKDYVANKINYEITPQMYEPTEEVVDTDSDTAYDTVMKRVPTSSDIPDSELLKSPYLSKLDLSEYATKACDMKIMEAGVLKNTTYVPPHGTRLVNIEVLSQVFSNIRCSMSKFCKGRLQIYESSGKKGSQSYFVVFCSDCHQIVTKFCSSLVIGSPADHCYSPKLNFKAKSEINLRALLGIHITSLTWSGFKKFSTVMDMQIPSPNMDKINLEVLEKVVLQEVDDSMRKAGKCIAAREDAVPSVRPGCVEITVSFDGSWKQRGHYSNVGFAAVIERKSRKVVDYELLNRICELCSKWSTEMIESKRAEYEAWWEVHKLKCKANFSGTSRAMESEAAVRIWNRSEDRGLVYSTFIGDGDGSGYNSVVKSGVYNGEVEIRKEECVGHLQKRLKTHLMKAKRSTKKQAFINHQLEEHKADRVAHLYAVVVGQHVGKSAAEMSSSMWRMFDHISENHETCPPGEDSYCFFQKRLAKHQKDDSYPIPKQRKCYFSEQDIDKIKEEFRTFASEEVCDHLRLGATQNINEALHSVIWANCLKTKYKSPRCNSISVALSILCFNEGHSALAVVLKGLGMQMSSTSLKYLLRLDSDITKNRERANSPKHKAYRRRRKIESKNREMKRRKADRGASRTLYQSDKFGSEVRSNAPAKRAGKKRGNPEASTSKKKSKNKDAATEPSSDAAPSPPPEARKPNPRKRARPQYSESEASGSESEPSLSQDETLLELESLSEVEVGMESGNESDGVCEECQKRDPNGLEEDDWKWIGCEKCERWFHDACLNIELQQFQDKDYICKQCKL